MTLAAIGSGAGYTDAEQDPDRMEFEVASVKPTRIDLGAARMAVASGAPLKIGKQIRGSTVEYVCMSLGQLICEAYDVNPLQVSGPSWLNVDRFDILCKRPEKSRLEDVRLMLRALLADRFKLIVHSEQREQRVVALVVGSGGAKVVASQPLPGETSDEKSEEIARGSLNKERQNKDYAISKRVGDMVVRSTIKDASRADAEVHVEAAHITMPELADLLTRWNGGSDRLVVDATNLAGRYDLSFDMPITQMGQAVSADPARPGSSENSPLEGLSDPSGTPLLVRSLRNLGLDLADRRMPVAKLVIDHLEKTPTAN